jgi:hypothetical protein
VDVCGWERSRRGWTGSWGTDVEFNMGCAHVVVVSGPSQVDL